MRISFLTKYCNNKYCRSRKKSGEVFWKTYKTSQRTGTYASKSNRWWFAGFLSGNVVPARGGRYPWWWGWLFPAAAVWQRCRYRRIFPLNCVHTDPEALCGRSGGKGCISLPAAFPRVTGHRAEVRRRLCADAKCHKVVVKRKNKPWIVPVYLTCLLLH